MPANTNLQFFQIVQKGDGWVLPMPILVPTHECQRSDTNCAIFPPGGVALLTWGHDGLECIREKWAIVNCDPLETYTSSLFAVNSATRCTAVKPP